MVEKHEGRDSPDAKERDTPPSEDEIYPEGPYCHGVTIRPNSINKEILYFFLSLAVNKGLYTRERRRTFFSRLDNILRKQNILDILFELNEVKAATVSVLCKRLELSPKSVYRGLKFLKSTGLIVQARPIRTKGRPATVYAIEGYTPNDIAEATQRDRRERSPGYTEAQRISQLILDDYFSKPEPRPPLYTLNDIYPVLRRETRGFRWRDLERLVLTNLRRAQVTIHYGGKR